jgi:KDO2-lipid IV(A) lauroyltransferase
MSEQSDSDDFLKTRVLHPLQAGLIMGALNLLRLLPIDTSSALCGRIARCIGPRLGVHKVALANLKAAFPEKPEAEIGKIAEDMWENLGRTAGEYPHLDRFDLYANTDRFTVRGTENVVLLRDDETCGIFFSGHIGNWEIVSLAATQNDLPLTRIYREPNNKSLGRLFHSGRQAVSGDLVPKGSEGAKAAMKALRDGRHLGMLVDQKMNDGIEARFFGRPAMTAPALALFALKFKCPVVPARVIRKNGARFEVEIQPPLELPEPSGDRQQDILNLTQAVNDRLEEWIREAPEQWLWVHRRWPKD